MKIGDAIVGALPDELSWFALFAAVLVCLLVLYYWLRGWVRDYGWNPVAWFRAWRFAYRQELLFWRRKAPMFEMPTKLYCGLPGSGKTLMATRDAIVLMRRGVRVLSNYYIVDPLTGVEAVRIESWFDMLVYAVDAVVSGTPTVFVIDEIHLWANARFYQQTPGWWLGLVAQRRHYGVGIIGTCQSMGQVEVALRRLIDVVVFVTPTLTKKLPIFTLRAVPAILLDADGKIETNLVKKVPRRFTTMRWWVYGGYSTAELVAVAEWSDDAETVATIGRLSDAAQALTATPAIPWVGGVVTFQESDRGEVVSSLLAVVNEAIADLRQHHQAAGAAAPQGAAA